MPPPLPCPALPYRGAHSSVAVLCVRLAASASVIALLMHHVTHVQLECSEAMKQAVITKDKEAAQGL
jgi:hypothetical protein